MSDPRNPTIIMYDYINGVIENTGENYKMGPGSATPASDHLFEIHEPNDDDNQFKEEKEMYHTITVQCSYLSNRGRLDIQQSITFHCTRMNHPTMDG